MVITPPVSVEQVSSPDDRFHCTPYKAVLTARACLSRQDVGELPKDERKEDYVFCRGCKLGAAVREQTVIRADDLLKKKGAKRRQPRRHRPSQTIAPSPATLAAVAALPVDLPKGPPRRSARPKLTSVLAPSPVPTAVPRDVDRSPDTSALAGIAAGVKSLAARTRQLLSAVRSARARLAAR